MSAKTTDRLSLMVNTWWTPENALELLVHCDSDYSQALELLDAAHTQAHRGINRIIDLREHTGSPVGLSEAIEAHGAVCEEIARRGALLADVARVHGIEVATDRPDGSA